MSKQQNFLIAVNKALHEEYCHKKLLKSIENTFDLSNVDEFLNVYTKTLYRIYCSGYGNKNKFVARGLEFLGKLAIRITLKCVKPVDIKNPNGTLSQVYDVTTDQFFANILKCSLKYALVENPEVRFNTCYFIMVLLQNIGNNVEIDYILCNHILGSLLELLGDTKVNIRLQALKALFRLQEPGNPDCVVMNAFLVLFEDPNSEVRKTVTTLIAPHPQSFAKIRERLTDADIGVRQAAYSKWADTNPKLYLKIVDRNFILTCGFADNFKKINQLLTEKLLPKWLNAYGGNYLDLLKALKLDADENDIKNFEKLCTKVMEVYLKIHPLSDILKYLPIHEENKVIPVEKLHIESVLYWSILVNFLRKRDDGEDYLQNILPELTPFSNYIERVIKEKSASSMDEWENLEYQNIILQLFIMASGFDMSDEVGRKTFYSLILQILTMYKFQQKVIGAIIKVAFQLNQNICTLTTDICHVISEIREPLVDDIPSEEKLRARNFQISQLKVKLHKLEIDEEDALKVKDFQLANIVHNEIKECQRQLENLSNLFSQSEKVRTSKDDPETICRCLDILIGLLQRPSVNKMSETLLICRDEFLMPLIDNNISDVHWRFILGLGLFSVMDKETAFKHANFLCLPIATYRAVPNYDKKALKISVACVTDLIRVYGVKVIGIEETNSLLNQENNQSNNRRKLYSEDMNEIRAVNKDDINIEFIIDIIVDMLDDQDEDVCNSAATAISRLMMYNFPVSPELITRLILKWYNPLTGQSWGVKRYGSIPNQINVKKDTKLQQQIGAIITCFTDSVKGSRRIVEKAVIPIISSLANAPRNSPLFEVDIENVLKFLSALTNVSSLDPTENIHLNLALSIIEKISNKPNDICTPYFAKLLTYLDVRTDNPESLRHMISSIEIILADVPDKAPHKNLLKFVNLLKISATCIPEDSVATVGDSLPMDSITIEKKSEGNIEETSADHDTSILKSPIKSSSLPRICNDSEETREVPKRCLYLHDISSNINEEEENTEEKNGKGNSSESEEDIVKIDHNSGVGKDRKNKRYSYRNCKKLSLTAHSMKIRETLPKIPEESDSEQSSKKNYRGRNPKTVNIKNTETSNQNTPNGKNIDILPFEGDTPVFVKCDYRPTKNGVKNGQNMASTKSPPKADNSSNSVDEKLTKLKNHETSSRQKTPKPSSESQNIKIISQVILGSSETSVKSPIDRRATRSKKPIIAQYVEHSSKKTTGTSGNESQLRNSKNKSGTKTKKENIVQSDKKTTRTCEGSNQNSKHQCETRTKKHIIGNSDKKMTETNVKQNSEDEFVMRTKKQNVAESMDNSDNKKKLGRRSNKSTTSKASLENLVDQPHISSTDEETFQKTLRQRPTQTNNVRNFTRNSVSSPIIILTPIKLKEYSSASNNTTNTLGDSSQCLLEQTPFKKRLANTPLSAVADRLSKKSSSVNAVKTDPTKSTQITRQNTRLSQSTSNITQFQRKALRNYFRKEKDRISVCTPVRKRRSDTPNSVLKQKPNKIAKKNICADQNKKQISTVNTDIRIGTSGNKNKLNKIEKNENNKKPTEKNKDAEKVQSFQNGRKLDCLRSQRIISSENRSSLGSPNNEKFRNFRKDKPNNMKTVLKKEKGSLVPKLIKINVNEEKNDSNKLTKQILRRSGRTPGEKLNGKKKLIKEKDKNEHLSSDNEKCKEQFVTNNNCQKDKSCDTPKVHPSLKSCRVLLNSDQNTKVISKASESTMSDVNGAISDRDVRSARSERYPKPKTMSVDIINESLKSRNGLKLNGNLSIEESPESSPFTSTLTRSRKKNKLNSTRNSSSKRHLDFSSTSEETILKTFHEGDEDFQILEDMSIENVSTSNSSENSKKENLSINTSSSSNSHTEVKTLRKLGRKHTLSPDSRSPKRKLLRSNQKRTLRSAV